MTKKKTAQASLRLKTKVWNPKKRQSKLKPRQFSQIGNDLEMLIVSHFEPLRFGFYANIQNFVAQVSRFGKRQRER